MKKTNWRYTLLSRVVPALEGELSEAIFVHYKLRKATLQDQDILEDLISRSARQIGVADYTAEQIEGALRAAFGVDTQLIQDGTYFVVESEGTIVGCGGWSRRRTLFGGDQHAERNPAELDPHLEAGRIRAFFVEPKHARRGIGTTILKQCEADALASGFSRMELMATLTGVKLYAQHGYIPGSPIQYELNPGLPIEFVPMSKRLLIKNEQED
jgi:N-acetylglutamate synthase-like GNAT family acetyltransferase